MDWKLDETEEDEYYGFFPPKKEYPPIIPIEITACLADAKKMNLKSDMLKIILNDTLEKIRLAKTLLADENSIDKI